MALLLLVLLLLFNAIYGQSLTDPRVYNFYFYLNTNPDLTAAGIKTVAQAQQHWLTFGINEGRQACGSYHVLQFLDNYPDLKQKYGTNYSAATEYYLSTGYNQQLLGYTPNKGAYGRYTISDISNNIWLSGSDRMAAAIDSLVWNGYEFINCWDHGRELQMAVTTQYGECYNPTEAGSGVDLQQTTTTSVIEMVSVTNNTFESRVKPAFWMIPGESESGCGQAKNTVNVSNFVMHKKITIGYKGIKNVIHYVNDVLIPMDVAGTQIEAPTAYLNAPFDTFYSIDLKANGNLTKIVISDNTGGHSGSADPVIIATSDGKYAQGVLAKVQPQRDYALFNFVGLGPPSNGPSKWSVVTYFENVKANTDIPFENFLCIGTLDDVTRCMMDVYADINQ